MPNSPALGRFSSPLPEIFTTLSSQDNSSSTFGVLSNLYAFHRSWVFFETLEKMLRYQILEIVPDVSIRQGNIRFIDKKSERKKGVDPPNHPRAKGLRRTRVLIGIAYHRHGIKSYLVLAHSQQEFVHHKVIVLT